MGGTWRWTRALCLIGLLVAAALARAETPELMHWTYQPAVPWRSDERRVFVPDDGGCEAAVAVDAASGYPVQFGNAVPRFDLTAFRPGADYVLASPDGRWVAVCQQHPHLNSADIVIHERATRRVVRSFATPGVTAEWTPDGRWLQCGMRSEPGQLTLLDPASGEQRVYHAPDGERVEAGRMSPDGRWLVVELSKGGTLLLDPRDMSVGQRLDTLASPASRQALLWGSTWSPNGRLLVLVFAVPDELVAWDPAAGRARWRVAGLGAATVAFAPDSESLLGAPEPGCCGLLRRAVLDARDGRVVAQGAAGELDEREGLGGPALSADGRWLAVPETRRVAVPPQPGDSPGLDRGYTYRTVTRVWDLATVAPAETLEAVGRPLAFGRTGSEIIAGEGSHGVIVTTRGTGATRELHHPVSLPIVSYEVSGLVPKTPSTETMSGAYAAAFSPDGRRLAVGVGRASRGGRGDVITGAGRPVLVDLASGACTPIGPIGASYIHGIAWRADGQRLAWGTGSSVVVADGSGRVLNEAKGVFATSVAYAADGRLLACERNRLVELDGLGRLQRLVARDAGETVSAGGRLLATRGSDGGICLRALDGQPLAWLHAFDRGQAWLLATVSGYFAGSPRAEEQFAWRLGTQLYSLAQYAPAFREPQRVRRILADGDVGRQPRIGADLLPPTAELRRGDGVRAVVLTAQGQRPLARLRLLRDGQVWLERPLSSRAVRLTLDAAPGDRRLTAVVTDNLGLHSRPASLVMPTQD